MLGKVIALVFSLIMVLSNAGEVFEQRQTYGLEAHVSTLSAIWAGDIDNDHIPEIIAGGIRYEAGITKCSLVMMKRNEISLLAQIPSTTRTMVLAVCNALEDEGQEIVVGSQGLYVYSRSRKLLREKSTVGDVTALLPLDIDKTGVDEIVYGTSAGDVILLVDFEVKYRSSVTGAVKFILPRGEDTFLVLTSYGIHCIKIDGTLLWSHSAKGEILGAVVSDINNDSEKELIYISGSSINSLSFDGQRETLILTPSASPLSLLVEDMTQDGKPDLIVVVASDHIVVYSNMKEEVQSLSFRREGEEKPLLYAADVTRDGKVDLIYGGIARVVVFENVTPSQELLTKGQQVLAQGEELYGQREYEKARAKFEEAERIFLLVGENEKAAQCKQYITEITEVMDTLSAAQTALNEGKRLFDEKNYEQAREQFGIAVEKSAWLAQKDSYYGSLLKEAQTWVDQCDLAIADSQYKEGETLFKEGQYKEARDKFEAAETIYAGLNSDKAQLCSDKIAEIDELLKEKPVVKEENLLLYVGPILIGLILVSVFLATRKKVSAKLERGHIYLLMEPQPKKSLQLVKEYGRLGYEGLVISKLSPEQLRKKKLKKQKILQFSTASREDSISPDNVVNILLKMKEFMAGKENTILLLDGLDYLVIQNTFDDALSLIQKLAESVTLYKGILLVTVNPKSLEEKQLVLLEGEMEPLEV